MMMTMMMTLKAFFTIPMGPYYPLMGPFYPRAPPPIGGGVCAGSDCCIEMPLLTCTR